MSAIAAQNDANVLVNSVLTENVEMINRSLNVIDRESRLPKRYWRVRDVSSWKPY